MNDQSEVLLDMLQLYAGHNFEGITTGDGSWFLSTTYGGSLFSTSEGGAVEDQAEYFCQENYDYNFFTSTRLLVLNFLPKGTKFNEDYSIDTVLPNPYSEKGRIARRNGLPSFSVHMDNSLCQRSLKNLRRDTLHEFLTHLIHQTSARVTFGYFGILKQKMKERVFRVKNKFWSLSPRTGMSSHLRTSREFSIIGWNA
jgi:hypothetical protein